MSAHFELGRFVEGNVYAAGWFAPTPGQRVYLRSVDGNLYVDLNQGDGLEIAYTWPRDKSYTQASRLAIKHFERRTGQDAFGAEASS